LAAQWPSSVMTASHAAIPLPEQQACFQQGHVTQLPTKAAREAALASEMSCGSFAPHATGSVAGGGVVKAAAARTGSAVASCCEASGSTSPRRRVVAMRKLSVRDASASQLCNGVDNGSGPVTEEEHLVAAGVADPDAGTDGAADVGARWQSLADVPLRLAVARRVLCLLRVRCGSRVAASPGAALEAVRAVEVALYRGAPSRDAYAEETTLQARVAAYVRERCAAARRRAAAAAGVVGAGNVDGGFCEDGDDDPAFCDTATSASVAPLRKSF
jgi:hypothetical protein